LGTVEKEIACLSELEVEAQRLAGVLGPLARARGLEVALVGELGGGKTTFVRMLAQALGVSEPVSSPSYVLQHEYSDGRGLKIEHWDLYRIRALPLELEQSPGPGVLRLTEWADRIVEFLGVADIVMEFKFADSGPAGQARLFQISSEKFGDLV
jgi:tRNA threonylcarbamoyladenosine biosynthesis protein TsaE